MISAIKRFFDDFIDNEPDNTAEGKEQKLQIATAALFIEMARADYNVTDEELGRIGISLGQIFNISEAHVTELVKVAEQELQQAACHFEFTSLINSRFSKAEKVSIIEHLWRIAYADNELEKYEEAMVRKIADLIYVSHSDFIAAKLRVKDGAS